MPTFNQIATSAWQGKMKPKTSLLDRALNDLGNIASGFVPGLAEIGSAAVNDAYAAAPFTPNSFKLPGLGKKMAQGMWNESALPPLLFGSPGEALERANARPASALLDASLFAPATTGLAKLGTNFSATRPGSMDLLGMSRTSPEFALSMLDREFTPSELPGRLPMHDGSIEPMREFVPGLNDVNRFGDDELWLRRTNRTMPLGKRPETILEKEGTNDGAKAQELTDLFSASRMPEEGSLLPEDPWREFTTYRAQSEPFALMGDAMSSLRGKIPDNTVLGPGRAIGRRVHRNVEKKRQTNIDDIRGRHEKSLMNAMAFLKEHEAFKGADEKTIRDAIGNEVARRALGVDEAQFQAAVRDYDPTADLSFGDDPWAMLSDKTVGDMRTNYGLVIDRSDPHDTSINLPDDETNFKEWYHNKEVDPTKIQLRALSKKHRDARLEHSTERSLAEESLYKHVEGRNSPGFSAPTLRYLKDGNVQTIELTPDNLPEHIDKALGHEDGWELFLEPRPEKALDNAMEGRDPNFNDLDAMRQRIADERLRHALSKYKAARKKSDAFDEHSSVLVDRNFTPFGEAGVVKALQNIDSNSLKGIEGDALEAHFNFLSELREQSAQNVQGWMGKDLATDSAINKNRMRGSEWMTGEPNSSGEFFPMVKESEAAPGTYLSGKEHDSIQEPPIDRTPGNPFEMFLRGEFSTDYKVILNDFEKNRNYLAGAELFEKLRSLAMRITPEQYEKHRGMEIREADAMNAQHAKGTFVRLQRDGILAKETNNLTEGLERLAAMQDQLGQPDMANQIRMTARLARHMDITDPQAMPMGETMMDPGMRAALKERGPESDEILILPTELYRATRSELLKGQQSLRGAFRLVTDLWKHTVLHMRFLQWMKNNVIGAHLMVGMAGGPKRYLETIGKFSDGTYSKDMRQTVRENMTDVMASGSSMQARETLVTNPDSAYGKYQRYFVNPLSEFNAKWADDPTRMIRLFQLMEDQLGVAAKMSGKEVGDLTPEQVQKFMDDPMMRDELARRTNTDMVDFGDMGEFEKRYVRSVFPFWSWMKGSAKASMRLGADHPGRIWAAGEVADVGEMALAEDQGTHIPDFAKAWWDPGEAGGNIIDTSGMNPYGSMFDFMGMGIGAMPDVIPGDRSSSASYRQFGSENMLSTMHPFLGGGIEALTGRNVFFGTPIPNASIGSTFMNNQADLPLLNLARKFYENETGPDATTRYDRGMALSNYMGIPTKDPRWGQVNRRGWDEVSERYGNGLASRELAPGWIN